MNAKHFFGVDVGITGAVARLDVMEDGEQRAYTYRVPIVESSVDGKKVVDSTRLFEIFTPSCVAPSAIAVERVAAMPRQGVVSMFSFGRTFGIVEAVAMAIRASEQGGAVEMYYPSASKWTKTLGVQVEREKPPKDASAKERAEISARNKKRVKEAHIAKAEELFPAALYAKKRGGSFRGNDNHADAILLAEYARRKWSEVHG
jgi:hypothetical protein